MCGGGLPNVHIRVRGVCHTHTILSPLFFPPCLFLQCPTPLLKCVRRTARCARRCVVERERERERETTDREKQRDRKRQKDRKRERRRETEKCSILHGRPCVNNPFSNVPYFIWPTLYIASSLTPLVASSFLPLLCAALRQDE